MSQMLGGFDTSADQSLSKPDIFSYYTLQVKELLSGEKDFLPFPLENGSIARDVGSQEKITCSSVEAGLSDYQKERLNALLWESVAGIAPKVNEMLESVVKMCQLQSELRNQKLAGVLDNAGHNPTKKLKISSTSSIGNSAGISLVSSVTEVAGNGISNAVQKQCSSCRTKSSRKWIADPAGKLLCYACGFGGVDENEYQLVSTKCASKGQDDTEDDLRLLLETDSSLVEEAMKKQSHDLLGDIGHMGKQLEQLLDTVVSACRPMSINEKKQLQCRIGKLAPRNFDRIAAIVQQKKPPQMPSNDEIVVDLLREDNITVQRLFYYVEAIEGARKILS